MPENIDQIKAPSKGELRVKNIYCTKDSKGKRRWVLASQEKDRDDDILLMKGLEVSNFEKAPRMFYNHKSFDYPIGKWSDFEKTDTQYIASDLFHKETEESLIVSKLVNKGFLNTASAGFMLIDYERDKDKNAWILSETELFETSVVNIPANTEAQIQLSKHWNEFDTQTKEFLKINYSEEYQDVLDKMEEMQNKIDTMEDFINQMKLKEKAEFLKSINSKL